MGSECRPVVPEGSLLVSVAALLFFVTSFLARDGNPVVSRPSSKAFISSSMVIQWLTNGRGR